MGDLLENKKKEKIWARKSHRIVVYLAWIHRIFTLCFISNYLFTIFEFSRMVVHSGL